MTDIAPMETELSQLLRTYKNSEMSTWSRQRSNSELARFVDRRLSDLDSLELV